MTSDIELYYEPVQILNILSDESSVEMSEGQSAFICGLLKQFRPGKIVEIGVAAGGTTVIMLNCIKLLNLKTQLFSIDISEDLYRDSSKKTGYLVEKYKTILNRQTEHTLYTGKYAVECVDNIGGEIDFLVLDTVHMLPGEILDFLAYFPYLKTGCVVVLHDTAMNQYSDNKDAFATRLLLSCITDSKISYEDANIAAFIISKDTIKSIDNLFSALMITWGYFPSQKELCLYRNFYCNHYTRENLNMFDMAVELNKKTALRKTNLKLQGFLDTYQLINRMRGKRVYVYGCGKYGKQFYHILEKCGIELGGFIISDDQRVGEDTGKIHFLSNMIWDTERDLIFIGVNVPLWQEICLQLQQKGITNYVLPNEYLLDCLEKF